MTSLKSGVKMVLMKKLSLYVFLVLLWCNVGFAELIIFSDIKIGDKISKYFNSQQISKYYFFDTEKTPGGEILYGKDKKYSFIQFAKEDEVLKGDYGFYQIYYENGTGKIVSIAGIDKMTNKDSCLQKRKVDVDLYTKKNRITSLFNKNQDKHTFPDGMIDDYVQFFGDKKFFSFSCYIYPGQIEYRVEAYENNYNDYVFKKWNES